MNAGAGPSSGWLSSFYCSWLSGTGASPIRPPPLNDEPRSLPLTTDKN